MSWNNCVIPFHLHPLGFVDAFTHFGADLDELLHMSEIDKTALDSPHRKISYSQLLKLFRAGLHLCKTPGLGLLTSQYFKWYYHGLVGMAITASSNFRQAGHAYQRYACLAQPYYFAFRSKPFYYIDNRLNIIVPIQYLISPHSASDEIYRFEAEFRLGLIYRILAQFNNSDALSRANIKVHLDYPKPSYAELYETILCSEFQFDCEHPSMVVPAQSLTFDSDVLRESLYRQAIYYCDSEFNKIVQYEPYSEKVRMVLVENVAQFPSFSEVSERLKTTTRTLARKLKQENTSFTDLLNGVRSEIATYLLQLEYMTVADVAECVGFTDTGNFRQAFKRWTGQSIGCYKSSPDEILSLTPKSYTQKLEQGVVVGTKSTIKDHLVEPVLTE